MKKIIFGILKGIVLVLLAIGALGILGSIGANEQDNITFAQMVLQILMSSGIIAFAIGLGILREYLRFSFAAEEV